MQGPPGTGKTHTIANLVSALLAQGQRVLVTSARDQALTVLRDKLPPAVRDLCVLLLSSARQDGADELDRTINALTDQVAASDPEQLQDEIHQLAARREEVRERITTLTEEVISLREVEVYRHPEIAPGYGGVLAAIVQRVRDNADHHSWIGLVPEDGPTPSSPPLSPAQAAELLSLLREDAAEPRAGGTLPDSDTLPSPEDLSQAIDAGRITDDGLSLEAVDIRDSLAQLDTSVTDELVSLASDCRTALHHLGLPPNSRCWDTDKWTTIALTARLSREDSAMWRQVYTLNDQLTEVSQQLEALMTRRVPCPRHSRGSRPTRSAPPAPPCEPISPGAAGCASGEASWPRRLRRTPKTSSTSALSTVIRPVRRTNSMSSSQTCGLSPPWTRSRAGGRRQVPPSPTVPLELRLASLTEAYTRLRQVDAFGGARERIDDVLVRTCTSISPHAWPGRTSPMHWRRCRIGGPRTRH
ncbi:AAA domain-containing protein [Streptomyces sp. NPDC058869]|uniref:AAA domain-containing protein n=1 Tax=Streptomyces sp. NPDC058869 TaxID=3346659 RepID=UPI00368663E3